MKTMFHVKLLHTSGVLEGLVTQEVTNVRPVVGRVVQKTGISNSSYVVIYRRVVDGKANSTAAR